MSKQPTSGSPTQAPRAGESAVARAASAWVGQLGRTIKICRLYDGRNPTVVRFREELVKGLDGFLQEHGVLELSFSSREILLGDTVLHSSESRDDNLALPFFRDGIRRLSFALGTDAREVNAIVDAVLRVTQRDVDLEDLVTLLWDA